MPNALRCHWSLDPDVTYLNHGSFGACPREVLAQQRRWIERMEAEPVKFMTRDLESLLDAARVELGNFLGADPLNLVFVPNATAGVNTVLRSLKFKPGDELLTTDHAYNACRNALNFAAECSGAAVRTVAIPVPVRSAADVSTAILAGVTERTKLVLLDHITSPTALIFPVESLVRALSERGIDTLVDGAHAPGMVPLNLAGLNAPYYAGNCHKWTCAPRGAGFLYVRPDRQHAIRPLSISHGANSTRTDRSRFHLEFDWTGTADFSAYLTIPQAIRTLAGMVEGGWPEILQRNRMLALEARALLCSTVGATPLCPDDMIGSIAAVELPPTQNNSLHDDLLMKYRIEVPIMPWPSRLLRISAQLYNDRSDYEKLAAALKALV